eukprot:TRINITY_DN912_c0_g1_i11.p1 TRINITY_DN912_c0_g1~~TRINITY_DN912_c0_g1_i11.p1  ORF type:complete len:511 (-),score=165.35 TRINITY_DN912_c0_g1_i11:134-1606(-)
MSLLSICLVLLSTSYFSFANAADPSALRSQGDRAFQTGDYARALESYNQLISLEPKSQLNFFKRAAVHLVRKSYDKALLDLDTALTLDPSFIKGYLHRAKVHKLQGDFSLARDDYDKILKLKANHPEATQEIKKLDACIHHIESGDRALKRHSYEEARQLFTQALEVAPDSSVVLLKRAQASIHTGNYADIVQDTGLILKSESSNMQAYLLRGKAYYHLGEIDVALRHFKEALRYDPEHKEIKAEFKKLRLLEKREANGEEGLRSGEYAEARDEFTLALDLVKDHPMFTEKFRLKLCRAQLKLKEYANSIQTCTRVIESNDQNAEAFYLRGEAKMGQEKYEEAVSEYERAHQLDPQASHISQALNHARLELKKSSRKDYYKILGITTSADDREIKKAFKKLALMYHPDKLVGVSEEEKADKEKQFKDIAEAYEVLSDSEKRAKYDRGEDLDGQGNGFGGGHGHNPFQHFFTQDWGDFGGGGGGGFNFRFG